jgi:hypothetical protein
MLVVGRQASEARTWMGWEAYIVYRKAGIGATF